MRKSAKITIGLVFAGLAAAGGAAVTATGLENTSITNQRIGGTVTQTVTGAVLTSVHYNFSDGPGNLKVGSIELVFTGDVVGRTVHINADNNGDDLDFDVGNAAPVGPATTPTQYSGTLDVTGAITFNATAGGGYVGLTTLDITVDPINVTP